MAVRMVYHGCFFLLLISYDRVAAYPLARNPAFGLHIFLEIRYEKENNGGFYTNKLCIIYCWDFSCSFFLGVHSQRLRP